MKEQQTLKKVFSYMEEYHMLEQDDEVVVGVSGGADSVCLLFVLLSYAKKKPISISVVHVNHKIREDAGEDAAFVKALCEEYHLPFYLYEADVEEMASKKGISTEEAGRMVRYEAFLEVAEKCRKGSDSAKKQVKIAVAHNENDQAETMLFHLFRGSDLKGLSGIRPVRENIIRPILCLDRQEIEAFLGELHREYRTDSTNEEDDYTRNRIRHHILPYAEEKIVSGAIAHISAGADRIAEAEEYLQLQTESAMACCVHQATDGGVYLLTEEMEKLHPFMRKRLLFRVITEYAPGKKDISSIHVKLLEQLFAAKVGNRLDLPFGVSAVKGYDRVNVYPKRKLQKKEENVCNPADNNLLFVEAIKESLEKESAFFCDFGEYHFDFCLQKRDRDEKKAEVIPQNQYTKWFDYDKIKGLLMLRTRQSKDQLSILRGENQVGHKSLKDYMITEKIPKQDRDRIPVLAVDNEVIWLVGYRIGEIYKVDEHTRCILQVQCEKADRER